MSKKSSIKFLSIIIALLMLLTLIGCTQMTSKEGATDSTAGTTEKTTDKKDGQEKNDAQDPLAKYNPIEGKRYKITWVSGASGPTDEDVEMVKYWEKNLILI